MKKSCSTKKSKVVTTEDAENVLNVSKEKNSKEQLTEEQLLINQKLLESGIDDEGLDWLEKKNIFKTINVSLDTAGSERLQRSSPRLTKTANSKWVENSFEGIKPENFYNEKTPKSEPSKKESETNPSRKTGSELSSSRSKDETEDSVVKQNQKIQTSACEKLSKDGETNCEASKSGKKVHYIKIQVEGNSKEECNSSGEGGQELSLGKKRSSQLEKETIETPKKLKMEDTNNGVSSEEETPLKVELEMEKRKLSAPFKMRDIKTIVSECEIRNKKWKETFSKYKCPTRWGIPIIRNCSEKWDGKQIPPKLLHRYQKYLCSNNLTHPIFYPVKSQSGVDLNKLVCEISSQSSTATNSDCKDEPENDFKHFEDGSFGDSNSGGVENNLNASTSVKDSSGRMVLRNRSQQKTVISDEEEFSSDDSDDWLVKQKSSKKQKINAKNKKAADQSNKQLVLKLERCNINRGNGGNEGGRKNGNKNDVGYTGGSAMAHTLNSVGVSPRTIPDPDTMVCPICNLRFKKQHIESHATECASKTYKD